MTVQDSADRLFEAERTLKPITALTLGWDTITQADAHQIQLTNIRRRVKSGDRVVGYKLGLTSREAQRQFEVFEPDYGHLTHRMQVKDGVIDASQLIHPRIEGELAFVMGHELHGAAVTLEDVTRAVEYVQMAMEIVDLRYDGWKVKSFDLVADNAASARFVLGPVKKKLSQVDLPHVGMAFSRNGEIEVTGAGAAVMGHPLNAVLFLVHKLATVGGGIRPGEVVLSGSLGAMLPAKAGDSFECEMLGLGKSQVCFQEGVGQ